MDKIILENFRCFKAHQEIELKPLTFLVGENSTGKTSFLAAIRLAADIAKHKSGPDNILDFNSEPYVLGAYEQIASYASGRTGRAKSFIIGYEKHFKRNGDDSTARIIANFIQQKGHPVINELTLRETASEVERKARINLEDGSIEMPDFKLGDTIHSRKQVVTDPNWLSLFIYDFWRIVEEKKGISKPYEYVRHANILSEEIFSIAPVRTKPERTYDPKSDIARPEGNHVPIFLRQLTSNQNKWLLLEEILHNFGRESGLFKEIHVRKLGRSESDPFQLLVKIAGPLNNLIDVGYGVSQVLPILVDSVVRAEKLFLMQQPEVHLHPKAQAELATFLGNIVKHRKKQLIVETHSDYLIDRICLEIRDKTLELRPEDIGILFFQRQKNQPWVKIHRIDIDQDGNIHGAPKGYREFFLKEDARLFKL